MFQQQMCQFVNLSYEGGPKHRAVHRWVVAVLTEANAERRS